MSAHSAYFSGSDPCTDHQRRTVRLKPMMESNVLGESIAQPNCSGTASLLFPKNNKTT